MRLGLGLSISKNNGKFSANAIQALIQVFKTRVLANSGTFEAESCLTTTVQSLVNNNLYDSALLIVTPNAYKSGKIYSIKPSLQSTFLTMGDSLTNAGLYQARIVYDQTTIWGFINKGVSGENTTQMLARFNTDIVANSIAGEYCVIFGGINDLAQGTAAITIKSNLAAMYALAKGAGLKVIAITTSPWKGNAYWDITKQVQQDILNAWILANTNNVDYKIDIYSLLVDPSVAYTLLPSYDADHLHWTTAGYNAVGDLISSSVGFTPTTQLSSGAGDLNYVHSTIGVRRNSNGKFETMAINMPRLNYPIGGGCPKWLFEPTRTSLVGYSKWSGGGATPTGWSNLGSGTSAVGASSIFFEASENVVTYLFTAAANYKFFYKTGLAVTIGQIYTLSVFIEAGTGMQFQEILSITGITSTLAFRFNGVAVNAVDLVTTSGRLEMITTFTANGNALVRVGIGTQGNNITNNVTLSCPQFELGTCASSPILTDTGATARNYEYSQTSLKPMIGQAEGTLYCEFSQAAIKSNDIISINRNESNSIWILTSSSGEIIVSIYASSGAAINLSTGVTVAINTTYKIAVGYKSGDSYISINGSGIAKSNSFTFNADLTTLSVTQSAYESGELPTEIGNIGTYLTRLTNSQLNSLTV